jgi:hypothetical protein
MDFGVTMDQDYFIFICEGHMQSRLRALAAVSVCQPERVVMLSTRT